MHPGCAKPVSAAGRQCGEQRRGQVPTEKICLEEEGRITVGIWVVYGTVAYMCDVRRKFFDFVVNIWTKEYICVINDYGGLMSIGIGTYAFKEDENKKCIVYAVFKSVLTPKWNTIFARRCNSLVDFKSVFGKSPNVQNEHSKSDKNFYKTLLEYLCFDHRHSNVYIEFDRSDTVFDEERFSDLYKDIFVGSNEIKVGGKYISKDGHKLYVLGIVRTDINDDAHTVIVRYNIEKKFNQYIDYEHDQFGTTPDFYNCGFMYRKWFLENYELIK